MNLPARARALLHAALATPGPITFLTGAGISAESGIPTFRGEDGYWRIGSRNWRPEELATHEAFSRLPDEIWAWYLYRRAVCRAATPNPAHAALAALERALGDRFRLVTQNVDGLHLRAGNTLSRTYQIHGNLDFRRCATDCTPDLQPIPTALDAWPRDRRVTDIERELLRCGRCGGRGRPHVLWFDETYDELRYRWQSSLRLAETCALLVVVGTSGATTLPLRMAEIVTQRAAPMLVLNPEPSPFTRLAAENPNGLYLPATAGGSIPSVVAHLTAASPDPI